MSAQGQFPGNIQAQDPAEVSNALLIAIKTAAVMGQTAQDTREMDEAAKAALGFAQALIVLDPSLSQGGTPLEHDLALEQTRGDAQAQIAAIQAEGAARVETIRGEHAIRQAKEAASAPTPAKTKSVKVSRDGHGRATGYDVSG